MGSGRTVVRTFAAHIKAPTKANALVSRRYPTAGNIKQTQELLAKLQPYEAHTPAWLRNYSLPYNLSVEGELAERGEREMEKLARRLLHAHGKIEPVAFSNATYLVAHTYKKRTKDSAIG